jgi:hypothetical protein
VDVPAGPEWRRELDGYIRRHEADPFAHAPMIDRNFLGGSKLREAVETRLVALERWQQRITGVLMFLAFVVGGGGVAVVIELVRK